jgi:amino acid transporter
LALISTFANMALFSAGARLATYLFTCAAVPRLRKLNEGFRTPGLWMPILGTLISLALVVSLDRLKLMAGAIALVLGSVIWFTTRPAKNAVN